MDIETDGRLVKLKDRQKLEKATRLVRWPHTFALSLIVVADNRRRAHLPCVSDACILLSCLSGGA